MQENSRKIKLLKLWELLKNETDEQHPMDTVEIIERLGKEGILVDRKILYSDIELLNNYGYEVMKDRSKRNRYYVMDRGFDLPEIRILMDAVQASAFVTEKKTEELIGKIASLAGSKKGEALKKNVVRFSSVKSLNELIFYSVDTIATAIIEGKRISFNYFSIDAHKEKSYRTERNNPNKIKLYKVNPVATVFDNDQYYLVCYDDKHKGLANYRIDRMERVRILEEPITENKEVEKIDIAKRNRQMFGMFGGDTHTVTFHADKSILDVIFDKFGNKIELFEAKDGKLSCKADVQIGPMFIAWCCSFGDRLKVVSPPSVVKAVKEHLTKTLAQYDK
ncbi:MAG: WYL domain-containing protein [Clostridia bacterium]|nr:WYL domain-containing protein [Clostridia bacterium]